MPSYRLVTAGALLLGYLLIAAIVLWSLYNPGDKPPPPGIRCWSSSSRPGPLATRAVGVLLGVEIQQGTVSAAVKDAQREAADAARKSNAIVAALSQLDAAGPTATAAGDASITAARTALTSPSRQG